MVTEVPDAATVLPMAAPDTSGLEQLAMGEYRRTVRENMPRDHVRMYHPDGTTSIVLLPPLGKNGRNARDRQQVILHHIMNKRGIHGEQWWYASPEAVPGGWTPNPLPHRCFVRTCTRAGGLPNWYALYMHVQSKHPGEMELYEGVLKHLREKIRNEIDPAVLRELGLADDTEMSAAVLEQVTGTIPEVEEPAAPDIPDAADMVPISRGNDCPDCGWVNRKGKLTALRMHQKQWCKKGGT